MVHTEHGVSSETSGALAVGLVSQQLSSSATWLASSAAKLSLLAMLVLGLVPQGLAQDPVMRMEQVVHSYSDQQQFMGTVLVAQGDKILLDKGYGSANLELGVPDTPTIKFRLGSITKQFTAASILILEQQGKLKTSDLVKKYIPDAPAAWDQITIYHLLTHTSGIPSFTSFPDYSLTEATPTTPAKLVERFKDKPLEFSPGEKWNYSNSGYVLLGYLIEQISGKGYEKFVQENIFKPLGMNDTGYDSNSKVILNRASGYAPGPTGIVNAGYIDMSIPFSAGALYSTTHDLLRWEQGLFGGKLLSPESLKKMTTPFKENYGCGLVIDTVNGHQRIEHGGGIEGFNTEMAYYPDSKLIVIALANLNGNAVVDIASKLATIAQGGKVVLQSERKEIVVPAETLARYTGSFELFPKVLLTVTKEGSQLFAQLTGQPKFQIFPESEKQFFLKAVDAQLTFETDAQGKVQDVVLHQNGRDMTAKLTSQTSPAAKEHKAIALEAKLLEKYVGSYQLAPNFSLVVTREGDHLFEQATGQQRYEIYPEGEKEFFLKVVDAQITFEADSQGKITDLILHQNGMDQKAVRTQ